METTTTPKTAIELLKYIDEISQQLPYKEQEKLYWILSAQRGPDEPRAYDLKRGWTAVIRFFSLPKLSRSIGCFVEKDNETCLDFRNRIESVNTHFIEHAHLAFNALGLEFDKENKHE